MKYSTRQDATTSLKEAVAIRNNYSYATVIMLNPCTDFETLKNYNIRCSIANLKWIEGNLENMKGIKWHLEWAGFMRRAGCRTEKEFLDMLDFAKKWNSDKRCLYTFCLGRRIG